MTRRSSRLQQKDVATSNSTRETTNDEANNTSMDPEDVSVKLQAPRRKRHKTAESAEEQGARKIRGKRGMLHRLTEMPLDILFEIFGNLEPIDLLHISRTTKTLRNTVLSKSAIGSWKQAFQNVAAVPACPTDMSEPSFASLLFDNFCHSCDSRAGNTIEWVLRMRFCNQCIDNEFEDLDAEFGEDPELEVEIFERVVPHLVRSRSGRRHSAKQVYHYKSIIANSEVLCKMSKSEKIKWIEEVSERHKDRRSHGMECSRWLSRRARAHSNEAEQIRTSRRDIIIQRLTDLGWGDEIQKMPDSSSELRRHPLVWQKKELTDRIWNNIQPALVRFMEDVKRKRIKWEEDTMLERRRPLLAKLRIAYSKTVPPNAIIPPAADLNDYLPFRDIIENTPPHEEVKLEDFDGATDGLPEFVNRWRKAKDRELLRIMGAPVSNDDDTDYSPLQLATTVFNCKDNASLRHLDCFAVFYPRVLIHDGASMHGIWRGTGPHEPYEMFLYQHLDEGKWNCQDQVEFNVECRAVARDLVTLCGLDPDTTTSHEMDTLDPVFECSVCPVRRCMRWREAISHVPYVAFDAAQGAQRHAFTLITDITLQTEVKLLLEQKKLIRRRAGRFGYFRCDPVDRFICVHCREKGFLGAMKRHVEKEHGKAKTTYNDVVLDMDVDSQITCIYQHDELFPAIEN